MRGGVQVVIGQNPARVSYGTMCDDDAPSPHPPALRSATLAYACGIAAAGAVAYTLPHTVQHMCIDLFHFVPLYRWISFFQPDVLALGILSCQMVWMIVVSLVLSLLLAAPRVGCTVGALLLMSVRVALLDLCLRALCAYGMVCAAWYALQQSRWVYLCLPLGMYWVATVGACGVGGALRDTPCPLGDTLIDSTQRAIYRLYVTLYTPHHLHKDLVIA